MMTFSMLDPLVYWFLFATANALLAYGHLSLPLQFCVGALGLFLPLLAALFQKTSVDIAPLWEKETFSLPSWLFLLALVLMIGLRFYDLTSFSLWPHQDESKNAYYALQTLEQHQWQALYGPNRIPGLFTWGLALLFHFTGAGLSALWAYAALLSALTVIVGYSACRFFFSLSFIALCGFVLGLNFWGLYTARVCVEGLVVPLAECSVLVFLGIYFRNRTPVTAFLFGLGWGLGFYSHFHWLVIGPILLVLFLALDHKTPTSPNKFFFFLPALVVTLPLIAQAAQSHFGQYLLDLLFFKTPTGNGDKLFTAWTYVTSLFWGSYSKGFYFGPVWGGLWNPILAAFFGVGFMELLKARQTAWAQGVLLAFPLLLLPGWLSVDLELYRIISLLPLMAFVTALGIQKILSQPVPRLAIAGALVLSLALDLYHLNGPYRQKWDDLAKVPEIAKSVEQWRAYELIQAQYQKEGPGAIFMDFVPLAWDQSLNIATYEENSLRNPALSSPRWAGVLTNINFVPFLEKRFPGSKWTPLAEDRVRTNGGLCLGIIEIEAKDRPLFTAWAQADQKAGEFTHYLMNEPLGSSEAGLIAEADSIANSLKGDPFFEGCFQEDLVAIYGIQRHDFPRAVAAARRALAQGYPSANLQMDLGVLLFYSGEKAEAREAFEKAIKAPGSHTLATDYLKRL